MAQDNAPMPSDEAFRALAHDARWHAIEVLGERERATATELAAEVGLSPSAMSYHLRTLERAGYVVRVADDDADGRERPWRLNFDSITFSREKRADLSPQTAMQFFEAVAASVRRRVAAAQAAPTRPGIVMTQHELLLTPDEVDDITEQVHLLLADYEGRAADDAPGLKRYARYDVVVPIDLD